MQTQTQFDKQSESMAAANEKCDRIQAKFTYIEARVEKDANLLNIGLSIFPSLSGKFTIFTGILICFTKVGRHYKMVN